MRGAPKRTRPASMKQPRANGRITCRTCLHRRLQGRRSLKSPVPHSSAMPPHRIDESIAFVPVRIAVLTVSDTRDASNDTSGDALAARIAEAGHVLASRTLLRDDQDKIAAQLRAWIADPEIDVVISTGGTGLTGRRVPVEALN